MLKSFWWTDIVSTLFLSEKRKFAVLQFFNAAIVGSLCDQVTSAPGLAAPHTVHSPVFSMGLSRLSRFYRSDTILICNGEGNLGRGPGSVVWNSTQIEMPFIVWIYKTNEELKNWIEYKGGTIICFRVTKMFPFLSKMLCKKVKVHVFVSVDEKTTNTTRMFQVKCKYTISNV